MTYNPKRKAENELKISLGNSFEWDYSALPPVLDSTTLEDIIGADLSSVIPWPSESNGEPLQVFSNSVNNNPPATPPPLALPNNKPFLPQSDGINPGLLVQEVAERCRIIAAEIERLGTEQKRVTLPVSREIYGAFDNGYKEVKNRIEEEHHKLTNIVESFVLDPISMQTLLNLYDQLVLLMTQNDLLIQEINGIAHSKNPTPVGAIVISAQPLPASVFKGKPLEGPVILQLLIGSRTEFISCAPIKAEVVSHPAHKSKVVKPLRVTNAEGTFGPDRIVKMDHIAFPDGSNNLPVQLKFTAKITLKDFNDTSGKSISINVESKPSKPLIVKTNEKQWEKAEGLLLIESAFGDTREVSWERFANYFYRSYLGGTRQAPDTIERPLSPFDIDYIHQNRFNGHKYVNVEQVEQFWAWIGPMLHKIRYTKRIGPMFVGGYICGFLTSGEIQELLTNQEVGTFVVRFSERQAAGLVISYQSTDTTGVTKVRHYQIKQDDIYASTKTLPDFLSEYRDLKKIIQIQYDGFSRHVAMFDKDRALKELYTKRNSANGRDGYEDEIVVLAKNLESL